jgi:hypothetical protein
MEVDRNMQFLQAFRIAAHNRVDAWREFQSSVRGLKKYRSFLLNSLA